LPHLLAYLDRRTPPDDLALPVLAAILEVLAYGESRTRAVRETVLSVLDRLLLGTTETAVYDDLIDSVELVWDDVRAPRTLAWLADVLALFLAHPCPSPERREALMRRALSDAATMRAVDHAVVDLLRVLASDPLLEGAFAAEVDALLGEAEGTRDPGPAQIDPGPLTIGIYTLRPAAAHQAIAVLGERYPSLEFELNHEKDDSDRLRGFAGRADIVAVVIASAKHAATAAIRRHCRPEALLEVGTAGSTGLVRAIVGRLEELVAA
jgi:hypothetical protein